MLWQFREKLDPCAAYSVSLGFFSVNFRTLPGNDFPRHYVIFEMLSTLIQL